MADIFLVMSNTTTITAGVASAAVSIPKKPSVVEIYNSGAVIAFIAFGNSAVTAAVATGYPIPPSTRIRLEKGESEFIATIVGSTTAVLYVTAGLGY